MSGSGGESQSGVANDEDADDADMIWCNVVSVSSDIELSGWSVFDWALIGCG